MKYDKDTSIQKFKKKLEKMNIDTGFLDAKVPELKKIKSALLKESPESKKELVVREFKINVIDKILKEGEKKPQISVETTKGLNGSKSSEYASTKPQEVKDTKHPLKAAEYKIAKLKTKLDHIVKKAEKTPSETANELINKIKKQINEAEEVLSEQKNELVIRAQLNEDAQSAESIMASIAIQEEIGEIQKELGKLQNDTLNKFIEQVRMAYDTETADKVKEIAEPAIQDLMDKIRETKDQLYDVVTILTGGEESEDDITSDSDLGDMESDSEELESSEENKENSEESDLDLDMQLDDETPSDEPEESEDWEKR